MRRLRIPVVLAMVVLAAAACGSTTKHTVNSGPPDAFIDVGAKPQRMVQGSSCWSVETGNGNEVGRCVDSAGPQQMHLKPIAVTAGAAGHIHLGFVPTHAILTVGGKRVPVKLSQTISFPATRAGIVSLEVRHPQGDAMYFARLSLD